MKSPEEIKKGLRCLSHDRTHTLPCSDCEYHGQGLPPCRTAVHEDAIALIQQLETQNAEKDARIQQLEKRVIHLEALNQSNLTTITMQERTRARLQERISQLEADNDRLTDEVCNAYNIRNEQLARIKQLEAELEDMTARYKIADDCIKKKGEMNEKLYAELSAVKAERDAAVADLEHVKDCDSCKYDDACFTGKKDCFGCHEKRCPCLTCQYEWRGVTKEETNDQ